VGQEVIQLAGHLKLGKLTFFWDDNAITDDGRPRCRFRRTSPSGFRVAGWHVVRRSTATTWARSMRR
jgi:transketolase